jgi:hypothetical protein
VRTRTGIQCSGTIILLTAVVALNLSLTSCVGSLERTIRDLFNRPTHGTVLAEILVGSYSEASGILADSLLAAYPDADLAVLEYHVDQRPLINRAAVGRAVYYRQGSFGLSIFVDGQPVRGAGGYISTDLQAADFEREVRRSMEVLETAVDRELRLIPPVSIELEVERTGSVLDISVAVRPVIDQYDDPLSLRIALVEERVSVPIPSGRVPVYQMVVRDMIGGAGGFPVEFTSDSFLVENRIDIEEVERQIFEFQSRLAELDRVPPDNEAYRRSKETELRRHSRIDPDLLRIVAFVQRETDRAVLQTAVFDLKP